MPHTTAKNILLACLAGCRKTTAIRRGWLPA
jgi:hypothetical protein